jgi:hypothetical protein
MNHWVITNLELKPHEPQILHSTDDARAIALLLRAGEKLDDHEVHERTWLTVLGGDIEVTAAGGERVRGGCGLVVELVASERRAVHAHSDSTIMLLLTPWPGAGHAGAMTLAQKANAQTNATMHRART